MKSISRVLTLAACFGVVFAAFHTSPAHAATGPELFVKNCAQCHGKDGKARTPAARKLGVKDLSLSKATDAEIEQQLIKGKKDDRGRQKMPAFEKKLSSEEIKSLIPVVKRFRNLGDDPST